MNENPPAASVTSAPKKRSRTVAFVSAGSVLILIVSVLVAKWSVSAQIAAFRGTAARHSILILQALILQYSVKFKQPPSGDVGLRALITKQITDDQTLFTDPWGHPIMYQVPGTRSGSKFDVYSPGPDGIDGTRDDIGNWEPPE